MGSVLNFGAPGVDGNAIGDVYNQVSLTGNSVGSSAANIVNSAEMSFISTADVNIALTFNLDYFFKTWMADNGGTSDASGNFTITLTDRTLDETVMTYNFSQVFGASTVGGADLSNGTVVKNLDAIMAQEVQNTDILNIVPSFSVTDSLYTTLVAGNKYDFSIDHRTSADATYVPAPTSIALMGLGLLGLGAVSKKRKA